MNCDDLCIKFQRAVNIIQGGGTLDDEFARMGIDCWCGNEANSSQVGKVGHGYRKMRISYKNSELVVRSNCDRKCEQFREVLRLIQAGDKRQEWTPFMQTRRECCCGVIEVARFAQNGAKGCYGSRYTTLRLSSRKESQPMSEVYGGDDYIGLSEYNNNKWFEEEVLNATGL